jgi:multisubunit Na+/H+ antiporter MnhB subunit
MDFLVPIMWHIGVNVLTAGIQVSGLILYLIGYRKKELADFRSLPFSAILLILWGVIVSYFAVVLYNEFMNWISQPFRREITIWDKVEYATMALKGLLWLASGLIFIVTALHPRK